MDLFQCSISLLTLMISFSRISTSKDTPNVIDARAQSINRGVHNGLAFAKFKAHRFSYLNITSLGIDHVFNGKECGLACVNIPSCFSYNLAAFYDISGRALCELLPSDKYNNSDNFTSSQLFHHFSIVSPCMSGPCQNGGSCVSVYKENSYVCLCTKGYTGSICQTDIDDCASNPCKNYGTCSDRVNGFNCICEPGFHGSLCEKDIDDCASHPCKNDGTCTDRVNRFNCTCAPGFNGTQCETDIGDCASQPCKNNGTCTDRVNGFNCSCAPGLKGPLCEAASTCKELYDENLGKENKAYRLKVGSMKIPVYCHMTSVGLGTCGGGGWTLVMKTDGTKNTFHFDSNLWSNKNELNLPGGKTGLDSQETKLPTYWNTSFSKICLGMKIGHQIKFTVINVHANSLYSLIADGHYRATSLGRNTWKTLIGSQASLEFNCNKEGFNAVCSFGASRTRIGFVGNNENNCGTCGSRIGFGTAGYTDDTNTCGNTGSEFADNGDRHIKTMCYILVQ